MCGSVLFRTSISGFILLRMGLSDEKEVLSPLYVTTPLFFRALFASFFSSSVFHRSACFVVEAVVESASLFCDSAGDEAERREAPRVFPSRQDRLLMEFPVLIGWSGQGWKMSWLCYCRRSWRRHELLTKQSAQWLLWLQRASEACWSPNISLTAALRNASFVYLFKRTNKNPEEQQNSRTARCRRKS